MNGDFPPWFSSVMGAVVSIALFKTKEQEAHKVRPIGILHPLERFLKRQLISQHKSVISDHLEPQQLGCSKASAHKLVHSVRLACEEKLPEGFVLVKLDFANAHSEISRASVLEELSNVPSLPGSSSNGKFPQNHHVVSHRVNHVERLISPRGVRRKWGGRCRRVTNKTICLPKNCPCPEFLVYHRLKIRARRHGGQ